MKALQTSVPYQVIRWFDVKVLLAFHVGGRGMCFRQSVNKLACESPQSDIWHLICGFMGKYYTARTLSDGFWTIQWVSWKDYFFWAFRKMYKEWSWLNYQGSVVHSFLEAYLVHHNLDNLFLHEIHCWHGASGLGGYSRSKVKFSLKHLPNFMKFYHVLKLFLGNFCMYFTICGQKHHSMVSQRYQYIYVTLEFFKATSKLSPAILWSP